MQLAIGRGWVLSLQFSVSLTRRVDSVCRQVQSNLQRRNRRNATQRKWEQDKIAGLMLSSWDPDLLGDAKRGGR